MIDWNATGSMLQGWSAFAGAAAVAWAAKLGSDTFSAWRKQKIAERKAAQAEEILTAAYNARRALRQIRSPLIHGFELQAAEAKIKEEFSAWAAQTPDRQKRWTTVQAYYRRLDNTKDQQKSLEECISMARALFGKEVEESIEKLLHQFWVIQVDAESYGEDDGSDLEFSRKIRRGMYAIAPSNNEANEVTHAIDSAIAKIETHCLPALKMEIAAP